MLQIGSTTLVDMMNSFGDMWYNACGEDPKA